MATAKQKSASKHANSHSFKPGNKAALGNDKTTRLSTLLDLELDKPMPKTVAEYDEIRSKRQAMAQELVDAYFTAKEPLVKKQIFDSIADRTEGKPKQATELTGANGSDLFSKVKFKISNE